ncbi:MAG: UDP-forming cellulose synthase catalytic subunit [Rhodoferax sp.]|uniref:UDP-forming cellulose synthase catalytic subunit n=1 Tax=Rhodoferax sp. TaxID=50421 RepID=UPI00262C1347|nr:UDP-forming cellulose synthase catalytic subunit [Rhodoferax sp.]MDD5332935.1 UDP-forming cellulose synthase catalytic subunit [Rhodoferax sp.]
MSARSLLLRWRENWGLGKRSRLNPRYLYGLLNESGNRLVDWSAWSTPGVLVATLCGSVVLFILLIAIPFSRDEQLVFSLVILAVSLYIRRYVGTLVTLILIGLSVLASTRYLYWRFSTSMQIDLGADLLLGLGLLAAEFYAWTILIIGFFQTIWPLKRKPVPLPDDLSQWPTVDIFIPSYNEPLSVVMPTVIAALALDWPRDKMKVYLLDDGRRQDFKEFAASVGVTHVTRPNNLHAKAGNINAALPQTDGELIAIFDCDHIPTRTFLQATVGWFLADKKLAMVQTPHHFLSPDPFERNLDLFRRMPNEGELFYGLVQDGNDLWNASFFCGSCAVLRRTMLLEVGGVAVETVTEDAHTALKLHRLGYNTAYLGVIQAAGLATESLSAHVGQRIRWARGMAQIFRVDNPVLGKGLRWPQRLCYLNAMLHFFYGFPRIVFLTAPLSYLFFEAHVIQASADLIAVYALPHLIQANIANSRMQGKYRHTFWAEVYETALAWYIMVPTTLALISPKFGQFNVTAKGGRVEREYFDWKISLPYVVILVLNVIGLLIGIGRLFWWNSHEFGTVLFNILWTVYNLTILAATLSVALESRQIRRHWRVQLTLPAMIKLPTGRTVACETEDFSEGGLALKLPIEMAIDKGSMVRISLFRGDREFTLPAEVVFNQGLVLRTRFEHMTMEDYRSLVAATFSRADAWQSWLPERDIDRPLKGLREVLFVGLDGIRRFIRKAGMTARWRGLETWKK